MPERKWFVLLAAFVMTYMSTGFSFGMGVIIAEILEEFDSFRAETIAVQSTNLATSSIFCCVSGVIIHRFGPRTAGILGTLCSVLGLCVSYFATSVVFLILSVGIVAGTGFSMLYLVAALSTNKYFSGKQNALAVAFVLSGVSFGGLTLPYLMSYFLQLYGIRGTLLLYGGMCFNCLPAAFILENQELGENVEKRQELKDGTVPSLLSDIAQVFKCKHFLAFTIAITITIACIEQLVITVVDYTSERGFDSDAGILLLLLMNLCNLPGRFFPSILKQAPRISILSVPILTNAVAAMAIFSVPSIRQYWQLATLMCLGHFTHGGFYTMIPLSVRKLLPLRLNSLAAGAVFSMLGILEASLGPASGAIKDKEGSYNTAYYIAGGCIVFSWFIFCFIFISSENSCIKIQEEKIIPDTIIAEPSQTDKLLSENCANTGEQDLLDTITKNL